MKDKNICLVGFMGAGKTAVSKKLAEKLGRERISTDDAIIKRDGRSIPAIFEYAGERYFREMERQCVFELSRQNNLVVDCGGGVVTNPENIENLKKAGVVIYLRTSVDVIYERVKTCTNRPLLQVEDPKQKIKELLEARKDFYAMADLTVDTDNRTVDEVCEEILDKIQSA